MIVSDADPLILGSASPRRREILASLGVPIRVVPGDADETQRRGDSPAAYLARVVRHKLEDVARRIDAPAPGVVVADTIVVVDDDILGKPRDESEARHLLGRIVGRSHVVQTRYAIAVFPDLAAPRVERTVESRVTMRTASAEEVARYAATGEGLDKAGAYAAQGIGAFLVEKIDGSFSNVVGLPACELVLDLIAAGLLGPFPRAAVATDAGG
jgi:septum formation protein